MMCDVQEERGEGERRKDRRGDKTVVSWYHEVRGG